MAGNLRDKIFSVAIVARDGEWLLAFLESLVAEKGLARASALAYRDDILQFLVFVKKNNLSCPDIIPKDIENFFVAIDEPLAKTSQARKLASLRQFYNFLWRKQYITHQPLAKMKNPKPARHLPDVLSEKEMTKLLDVFAFLAEKEKLRMMAMMELTYGGGLRVSEMVGLPLQSLLLEKKLIRVMGKGQKERWAMMNDRGVMAVKNYLAVRQKFLPKNAESPYLFPSSGKKGAMSESGHITRQRFHQMLKDLARAAGIADERVTPHGLRHAFATHFLTGGGDVRSLQILLGHQHITTTEIYTHLDMNQKRKLVLGKHPMIKRLG